MWKYQFQHKKTCNLSVERYSVKKPNLHIHILLLLCNLKQNSVSKSSTQKKHPREKKKATDDCMCNSDATG